MRKHPFDPTSFILGLVISGVAVAYLVAEAQDRSVDGAWVLPLALIGLGVAAVASGLNRALRRPVPVGAELATETSDPVVAPADVSPTGDEPSG